MNDSFVAVNRLLGDGRHVSCSQTPVTVDGHTWPAGTFVVPVETGVRTAVESATAGLGLVVGTISERPRAQLTQLSQPRIGLYRGWGANVDEGWTRLVLEEFEFPYTRLVDADLRQNRLSDLDVIVLPDATYNRMLTGLGSRDAPPEYQGGMTPRGVSHLYDFVEAGGTLVALDSASELPIVDFGLPIRDVTTDQSSANYYVPGTILELQVNSMHPVAYGMPSRASGFFARSPAFSVEAPPEGDDGRGDGVTEEPTVSIVAQYPERDLLPSGWILGEEVLASRAAVVDVAVGRGRVVLLGLRAQHRGQAH